jgi:hypothetical protein
MAESKHTSELSSSCVAGGDSHSETGEVRLSPSKTINGARAKRHNSKVSSSKAKSRLSSRRRTQTRPSQNGTVDEEGSGNDNSHCAAPSSAAWLACPFFKHDPAKYSKLRACQTPGWPSVGRVREHIMRRHEKDMTASQIDKLRSRSQYSSKPDEKRWVEIFHILFPEVGKPPTPYCSDLCHEYFTYFDREVSKLLRETLAQDNMFKDNPILMRRISEMVSDYENLVPLESTFQTLSADSDIMYPPMLISDTGTLDTDLSMGTSDPWSEVNWGMREENLVGDIFPWESTLQATPLNSYYTGIYPNRLEGDF